MIDYFEEIKKHGYCGQPVTQEDVANIEKFSGLQLPSNYKDFLLNFGALQQGDLAIAGLGVPYNSEVHFLKLLGAFHKAYPLTDPEIFPIRIVGINLFHCLESRKPDEPESPVFLLDAEKGEYLDQVAPNFNVYLHNNLFQHYWLEKGINTMISHVAVFEKKYLDQGKIARNHIWRPYRFCTEDVILGLVVVKVSLEDNSLDIDVCLTSEVAEFEPFSGTRMTLIFLLSEAYKCGGSMQLRFSENVEDRHVPQAICGLAQYLGIFLGHVHEGIITPDEARKLYLALTDFSPKVLHRVEELVAKKLLCQERICYMIHHGLWSHQEIEILLFLCENPDTVFRGDSYPDERLIYLQGLLPARFAALGETLDRKLLLPNRVDTDGAVLALEDDCRDVTISFDEEHVAKVYFSETEDISLPWLSDGRIAIVPTGKRVWVLIRGRNGADLLRNLPGDIKTAINLRAQIENNSTCFEKVIILVPFDFCELENAWQKQMLQKAQEAGIEVAICPEGSFEFDTISYQRFVSSRIIRQ